MTVRDIEVILSAMAAAFGVVFGLACMAGTATLFTIAGIALGADALCRR